VVIQNSTTAPLQFSLLPKENEFCYMGHEYEVAGNVADLSFNLSDLQPGQHGFYAFNIKEDDEDLPPAEGEAAAAAEPKPKKEIRQLMVANYEAALKPETIEELKQLPEDIRERHFPKLEQGIGAAAFMVEIYNDPVAEHKRIAMLADYYFKVEDIEAGYGDYLPEQEPVYSILKPKYDNLPVDDFSIDTSFKNDDHAVLFINLRNNANRINAAVLNFFAAIDKDHSGQISKNEFVDYCRAKNPSAKVEEIGAFFDVIDQDKSSLVTLAEFVAKLDEIVKFINDLQLKFETKMANRKLRSATAKPSS
jgi:hypothetical protein